MNICKNCWPILVLIAIVFNACKPDSESQKPPLILKKDAHSYSEPEKVIVETMNLDLSADFDKQTLSGFVTLGINNHTETDKLILDIRDLDISEVTLDDNINTTFSIGEEKKHFGSPMIIDIKPETKSVTINYTTSPDAPALQWLSPEQTRGKKHPFLFTQSQAILARSWIPCQDSPGVKFTYTARIKVPPGLLALMSAGNNPEKSSDGIYNFSMPQPIPSYLMALAIGDIDYRSLGPICGVYAEPDFVDACAREFEDMQAMIDKSEAMYGEYRWEEYDVIVLPPSFPFGGMENPRLTFATPTIIAGDKSLVALVAHELAHSWSGNLVTNATWDDFWLNEGFTVYFENRIMEQLYGSEYSEMLEQLGLQDLKKTIEKLGSDNPDTKLLLDLEGRDPDEGLTDIAYEKGRFFLKTIEMAVGRKAFDEFLNKYFDEFAFGTQTTEGFLTYLDDQLIKGNDSLKAKINIDAWVYGTGLPDNCPEPNSDEFEKVEAEISSFLNGRKAGELATEDWTTHHWLHFLRNLPDELSPAQTSELDAAFNFTSNGNSEILCQWYQKAIHNNYKEAYPEIENFLIAVGRRKFLTPIYSKLASTEEGLTFAKEIYQKARPGYHSVSYNTIDQVLGLK